MFLRCGDHLFLGRIPHEENIFLCLIVCGKGNISYLCIAFHFHNGLVRHRCMHRCLCKDQESKIKSQVWTRLYDHTLWIHVSWTQASWKYIWHSLNITYQMSPARRWKWKCSNGDGKSKMDLFWCIIMTNKCEIIQKYEESKLSYSIFVQWYVRIFLLKTWKTRQTKTWITQNLQILYPIQGTTMWKLIFFIFLLGQVGTGESHPSFGYCQKKFSPILTV